jgi:hypothetical protein
VVVGRAGEEDQRVDFGREGGEEGESGCRCGHDCDGRDWAGLLFVDQE